VNFIKKSHLHLCRRNFLVFQNILILKVSYLYIHIHVLKGIIKTSYS